ncbi:MAG: hypothetical protein JXR89_06185, partial [Deltaproteobacteria bacterium]|nr:hypothetical protein [Deltaproteobacteria bacterium]
LIGTTVNKVSSSREIAAHSLTAVNEVVEKSTKVGNLVSEISAASQEQSNGIGQINIAVSEMDKVTQQNAANAEESAAAAEELNAQAEQMNEFVGDLTAMVTVNQTRQPPRKIRQVRQLTHHQPGKTAKTPNNRKKPVSPAAAAIPFNKDQSTDDFDGF